MSGQKEKRNTWSFVVRWVVASILLLAVCMYVVGIVSGKIAELHKLGGADVGIVLVVVLAVAVLLRPEFLDRLTDLKVGGVEVKLQKLQEDQQQQRGELDNLRFVLTLLLQRDEREHLSNLEKGATQNYRGDHKLRTELRRLRTLGLIENLGGHKIAELGDNSNFDLKNYVELTDRGRQYLERIREDKEKQSEEIE